MDQYYQECRDLSHAGLQSFITQITKNITITSYKRFLTHPNLGSVGQQYSNLLKLFAFGTYEDYKNKKDSFPTLNEAQILHLKILTILTIFEGMNRYELNKLDQVLDIDRFQLFQILMKISVQGLAKIKIDEEKGIVNIYQIRLRDSNIFNQAIAKAKITKILQKNNQVYKNLEAIEKMQKF